MSPFSKWLSTKLFPVICRNWLATQQSRGNIAPTVNYSSLSEKRTPSGTGRPRGRNFGSGANLCRLVVGWGWLPTALSPDNCILVSRRITFLLRASHGSFWGIFSRNLASKSCSQKHLPPHLPSGATNPVTTTLILGGTGNNKASVAGMMIMMMGKRPPSSCIHMCL